ncbi:hypothetical protein GCM10028777_00350 [Angustibacter speluncae]
MGEPSARVARRVRADLGADAVEALGLLTDLPETLPLGAGLDPDRVHGALVLAAGGDLARLREAVELARTDWRDALVAGGLADDGWRQRLDVELGPA